jgi:mRNA-degrading endonuclease RelE of RelBE toxin-antitoxin system
MYVCRMARKEVDLSDKTIKRLQKLADKDKRKLKPYMEKVLDEHSDDKGIKLSNQK